MTTSPEPVLDFWFEFGSNYSYLTLMRIEEAARGAGVRVRWKPFLLGPIFKELGWKEAPFVQQKEKGAYAWRDVERRAARYGLAFRRPSEFPRSSVLGSRIALLAAGEPWVGEFCRRITARNYVQDLEIASPEAALAALDGLVADPAAIIRAAGEDAAKAALRAQTEEARRLGIFGAPTFFAGGEMFWGDDRLEDALEAAQGRMPQPVRS